MAEKEVDGVISTGVDKLVRLVMEKGRISIKQASKLLGADEETIEDWAQFLEDGGLISIEYSFTTPYLVGKKPTKGEVEAKQKELAESKDIFMRKTESAANYLDMLDKEVARIEEVFEHLEKHADKNLKCVEGDLYNLEKAEKEKDRMDKEISDSKEAFMQKIAVLNKKLRKEEEDYKNISKDIKKEVEETAKIFDSEKKEAQSIVETEKYLEKKLEDVKKLSDSIQKRMDEGSKKISDSEGKLESLMKRYEDMKENLEKEKQGILSSMNENKLKEVEIMKKQDEILGKMKGKRESICNGLSELEDLPKKFRLFMSKKATIKEILDKIKKEEKGLKEKLEEISKKGKLLKMATGKEEFSKDMKALEKELESVTKKRGMFEEQLKKLTKFIKP
jgi:chromosome segregation ATPase